MIYNPYKALSPTRHQIPEEEFWTMNASTNPWQQSLRKKTAEDMRRSGWPIIGVTKPGYRAFSLYIDQQWN